jgi:hypothetical protein
MKRIALAIIVAASIAVPAHAVCFKHDPTKQYGVDLDTSVETRTFPVVEEYQGATYVVIAKAEGVTTRPQTGPNDRGGPYAHSILAVSQTFKGGPPSTLVIDVEFNSGRFAIDVGKTYLLFVQGRGRSIYVDNCGWSDELSKASGTLKKVKALSAGKPH